MALLIKHGQELQDQEEATTGFRPPIRSYLRNQAVDELSGLSEAASPFSWRGRGVRPELPVFVENGLLDLATHKLQHASPDWVSTACLPVRRSNSARCRLWERFVEQTFDGDSESIGALQEFFGYSLSPSASYRRFLFLLGSGANGKSVITNVLTALVGLENTSAVDLSDLTGRFQLSALHGKLVNVSSEAVWSSTCEDVLKRLTGGDALLFERKHRDPFTAVPTVKMVFSANALPAFRDRSHALWDRFLLLRCVHRVNEAEQDRGLAKKLEAELPGILNWSLAGHQRLRARGHFLQPSNALPLLGEVRAPGSSPEFFCRSHLCVAKGLRMSWRDAYSAYTEWALKHGLNPASAKLFTAAVDKVFPEARGRRLQQDGKRSQQLYEVTFSGDRR